MNPNRLIFKKSIKKTGSIIAKWLVIIFIISMLIGISSAIFLIALAKAEQLRALNPKIILLLPLAGFVSSYSFQKWGKDVIAGNKLIVARIRENSLKLPFKMAPFIFLSTLWSHLFGASVGREGTAVQMATAIAEKVGSYFKLSKSELKALIIAGVAGGFGAVFGTPWSGALFALEALHKEKFSLKNFIIALSASFLSNYIASQFPVNHNHYPTINFTVNKFQQGFTLLFAACLFGFAAQTFIKSVDFLNKILIRIKSIPWRTFAGGLLILALVFVIQSNKYNGLGVSYIIQSFSEVAPMQDFAFKILLTTLAIASGFKGGEVTPLFFIGATFGSALSPYLHLPSDVLAGMGLVAVFGAASKSPLASSILGIELFGWAFGPYSIFACFVSFLFSGKHSIYTQESTYNYRMHRWIKIAKEGLRNRFI